jgi:hypothetical protein
MVHHLYTHKTLGERYSTVAALKAAPELQDFLDWIRGRPVTEFLRFTSYGVRY